MQDIRVKQEYDEKRADKQRRHNGFGRKIGIVSVVFVSRIVCVKIGSMHSIILKYLRNADFSMGYVKKCLFGFPQNFYIPI